MKVVLTLTGVFFTCVAAGMVLFVLAALWEGWIGKHEEDDEWIH